MENWRDTNISIIPRYLIMFFWVFCWIWFHNNNNPYWILLKHQVLRTDNFPCFASYRTDMSHDKAGDRMFGRETLCQWNTGLKSKDHMIEGKFLVELHALSCGTKHYRVLLIDNDFWTMHISYLWIIIHQFWLALIIWPPINMANLTLS